jgi:hypothetical protein
VGALAGRLLHIAPAVTIQLPGRAIRRLEALVDLEQPAPVGHPESPALSLLSELERADELDLESRLVLLRRVESTIATSLEGLDGL